MRVSGPSAARRVAGLACLCLVAGCAVGGAGSSSDGASAGAETAAEAAAPQEAAPTDATGVDALRRALRLHADGDYAGAMAVYDGIDMTRATNAAVWYGRARTEQALGRFEAARQDAEIGMARDPRIARLLQPYYAGALRQALSDNAVTVAALNAAVPWGAAVVAHSLAARIQRSLPDEVRVAAQQRALAFVGHYDGPVDGIAGPATRTALDACIADACWTRFTDAM